MEQKFKFHTDWILFANELDSPAERLQMYDAIMFYVLTKRHGITLQGKAKDYFDTKVKPLLDARK